MYNGRALIEYEAVIGRGTDEFESKIEILFHSVQSSLYKKPNGGFKQDETIKVVGVKS